MNILKNILLLLIFVSTILANETAWKQIELTQKFMSSLTKDQCVLKTISSLKVDNPSEKYIKILAGITGDCVTLASGNIESWCKSYSKNYIRNICSKNILDARDCTLIHVMYISSCFVPKYQ